MSITVDRPMKFFSALIRKSRPRSGPSPKDMLAELCTDNQALTRSLRAKHKICEEHKDVATTSLIEIWIDEAERRTWFLWEAAQHA